MCKVLERGSRKAAFRWNCPELIEFIRYVPMHFYPHQNLRKPHENHFQCLVSGEGTAAVRFRIMGEKQNHSQNKRIYVSTCCDILSHGILDFLNNQYLSKKYLHTPQLW